MHRFFVPPASLDGDAVTLEGSTAHQLFRVLRARAGDRIVVLDNSGWEHRVTLDEVGPTVARGTITDRMPSRGEPEARITLYQAVLKSDRFDFVLQKGTELGVSSFVPVYCARSVPRETGERRTTSRYPRWRRIITEAAEQSRRGRIPSLAPPVDFITACEIVQGTAIIPWEEESETSLKSALGEWNLHGSSSASLSVFTGPEGGFTSEEVEEARARGIAPVTLGRRTLRAETASIAALAAIMYELGELGE